MKYYPRDFSRNADNKISIDVEFLDTVTGVSIKKKFDFENNLTNTEMNTYIKTQAPAQEEFDAIKAKNDEIATINARVEQLTTNFLNQEFTV